MELAERLSARLVALQPLRLLAGDALPISDRRPGLSGEPVLSASGATTGGATTGLLKLGHSY